MKLILDVNDLKKLRDEEVEKELRKPKSHKEIIALAKVGLNAVIDEVTGYQKERFKKSNELKKMYKNYIGEK